MNNTFSIINILALFLVISQISYGQELPSEEVEVIKNFDARLANAERLDVNPQLPSFDTTELDYNFSVQERTVVHTYSPPVLRSLGVPRSPEEERYNGYLRAGYGLPSSPLVDAFYGYDNEENFSFLLDAQHYSVDNTSNLAHQFIMENDVKAETRIIASDALAINAYADYSLDRYDLYGYDHALDSFSDFAAERRFNTLELGASFQNHASNSAFIDYKAGIYFRNHKDNRASGESTLGFDGSVSKWFRGENPLKVEFGAQTTTFNDTLDKKLSNLHLIPSYSFYKDDWSLKIGAQWATSAGQNYFYPEVNLQARISGSKLIGFVGSNGGLQPHTFFQLTRFNPYINSNLDSLRNTSSLNFYGGVKGKIDALQYEAKATYSDFKGLRMFETSMKDNRFFSPIFDDGYFIGVDASASYEVMQQITLSGAVSYKYYNLDSFAKAWYLPAFISDGRISYSNRQGNFNAWTGIRYQTGVPIPSENEEYESLEGIFDLSLGLDYYFTEKFGLFAHAYNITNNNAQRWASYPNIGTNVLGGILVRF